MDPNYQMQNEPPNIIYNAGTWAMHMGLSANLRYQVLGGTDRVSTGSKRGMRHLHRHHIASCSQLLTMCASVACVLADSGADHAFGCLPHLPSCHPCHQQRCWR